MSGTPAMSGAAAAEHYLSSTQVAELIGVQRGALSRYRLPEPDATIGKVRGWRRETITEWQARRPGRGGRWDSADSAQPPH